MSFALSTLTLLYLIAPGLVARRFYFTGEFSQQFFKTTFADLLVSAIFPNVFIHCILYSIMQNWYVLNTNVFSALISGTDDPEKIKPALENIVAFKLHILLYLFVACLFGAIAGFFSRFLIRSNKWDRSHRILRFKNNWHYLFSGEILDYPGMPGNADEIDLKAVDVLVATDEGSILYSGTLKEYILNQQGGIDAIYLGDGVRRRFLKDDNNEDDCYYHMPGDIFMIPYNEIKNIHITYYAVEIEDKDLQNEFDNTDIETLDI